MRTWKLVSAPQAAHFKCGFSSRRLFKGRFFNLRPDLNHSWTQLIHLHKYTRGGGFCREFTPRQVGSVLFHSRGTRLCVPSHHKHTICRRSARLLKAFSSWSHVSSAHCRPTRTQLRHQLCSSCATTPASENCSQLLGITTGT